jgi:ketosteroid isomerase-like protein
VDELMDLEVERKKAEQVWHDLCKADMSKELDKVLELYSDDVIYQVSGFPPICGKDALQSFSPITLDSIEDLIWGVDRTEVSESGDLAYSSGWFNMKLRGLDDYLECKGILVYRKVSDEWKIVAESYSVNSEEGRVF